MDAIDLQGEWEFSFDETLDGTVIPLPNPYHRLMFGPATSQLRVGTGAKGVYTIEEFTGKYGPPDPPSPLDPSTFVAQVFFAAKRLLPSTVISIIQKREAGDLSYYAVYSGKPLISASGTVDLNTIQGSYVDIAGNQGDFKLVRSS